MAAPMLLVSAVCAHSRGEHLHCTLHIGTFFVSRSGISPSGICHHCICTHFAKGKLFGCNTGRVLFDLKNKVGGFSSATSIKRLPILSQIDTSHYVMTCLLEMTLLLCTTISDMSSSNVEKY